MAIRAGLIALASMNRPVKRCTAIRPASCSAAAGGQIENTTSLPASISATEPTVRRPASRALAAVRSDRPAGHQSTR